MEYRPINLGDHAPENASELRAISWADLRIRFDAIREFRSVLARGGNAQKHRQASFVALSDQYSGAEPKHYYPVNQYGLKAGKAVAAKGGRSRHKTGVPIDTAIENTYD